MQTLQGIRSILRHDNGFVVMFVPGGGLIDHVLGNHVQTTGVRIPGIIAIEADNVQRTSLGRNTI